MKKMILLLLAATGILISACQQFPTNPALGHESKETICIGVYENQYVSSTPPAEGIAADKVNLFTFPFYVENFTPVALEFFCKATLCGPPDTQEHAVTFRTDIIPVVPDEASEDVNIINVINTDIQYQLTRIQFPTNEYSPFEGSQGQLIQLEFTEVWAIDNEGVKKAINIEFSDTLRNK